MKRGALALVCAVVLASVATSVGACGLATSGTADDVVGDASSAPPSTSDASGAASSDASGFVADEAGGNAIDAGVDATPPPYTTRVASNLIALYEFEENTGTKINDKTTKPYDLEVDDSSKIAWHPHYLEITDYTMLTSSANFDKFATAISASNAFTVETWVRFGGVDDESGDNTYGRLVSIADGDNDRDVELGDILGEGATSGDGFMGVVGKGNSLTKGTVPATLVHLVLVASGATLTMYVNGASIGSVTGSGSDQPNNHDDEQPLYVANDESGDRGVKGDLHLLAFYSVALTASDVATNYAAGADP